MSILLSWLVLTLSVLVAEWIIPGVKVRGFGGALLVAALFGLLNLTLGWVLFVAIGLGTLGIGFLFAFITRWIVNTLMLKLVDALTESIDIRSFGTAALAALVMSGTGTLLEWLLHLG